ncbi:TetR/AcrR family transcriptional regulator [Anaerocolumna sp.]|uniref:TetR/AcrR family transcriptional regulator n=1 Tax=Anaerocolumna sp. TaxID=2041569 RepID=UPI0028AB55D3|nr:TetR/AcrR family transcriptional regulator [Anaerocolumna sp.]
MPKCYSQQEREYIIKRLKEEAAKCLSQYGIKRTTVDEIVKRVKIPKGTFYLFYKSKELLLFDVILEEHDKIEKQLLEALSSLNPKEITFEEMTDLLFSFFKAVEDIPILKMLNSGEIEILTRKLPEDIVAEHLLQDNSMIERLFEKIVPKGKNMEVFSVAFRNIYFATLHKNEFDERHYDDALKLLIRGLVIQLLQ